MEDDILGWRHYRVVHSRFPPKNLFDKRDAARNLMLGELEDMTNDRLHQWREFVSPEDFRRGEGWGAVMAAFCYSKPGRFNTSSFGAYYCADSAHTAIAEWSHHSAQTWRDLKYTDEASAVLRCYTGTFKRPLIDVRSDKKAHSDTSYAYSQALAQLHRTVGAFGLIYNSVRLDGGVCAALLRPPATSPVKQAAHYSVQWNGDAFVAFAKVSGYEPI